MAGETGIHVTVAGEKSVLAKIEALGEEAAAKVNRAILTTGINVQAQAKRNASDRPGPRVDTGRLRSSIRIRRRGIRSDAAKIGGFLQVEVFTEVFYAPYLEFGWKDKYGNQHGPYPFLFPAWEAERGALMAMLGGI